MFSLTPTSVALIGASDDTKKLGGIVLQNLTKSGYAGKVFPVNPKHESIAGMRCYASILDIDASIDLAVIVTPASTVLKLAEECAKKKVAVLVIISAGFSETGTDEGREREERLQNIAQTYGIRIIGPNCLGILRPDIKLNASFAALPSTSGSIGLISQSGAMAVALIDGAREHGIGFSSILSIGNKADIDECDAIEALGADEATRVIGLYVESVQYGSRFMEIAGRVAKTKPIVLIKAGTSTRGAKAVASHTGALAGSHAALEAACRRTGVRLASTMTDFLGMLNVLQSSPPLRSPSIGIITNAGGPGVLATDAVETYGLTLATLEKKTTDALAIALPRAASTRNPIDVLGDALVDRYEKAIDACAEDPEVNGIAVLLTPQVMTPCDAIAHAVVRCKKRSPLLPIVAAFMGGGSVTHARSILRKGRVPTAESPESAIAMLSWLKPAHQRTDTLTKTPHTITSKVATILQKQRGVLDEDRAASLLALYDIPTPEQAIAQSVADACAIATRIGYPVIAKISSPDIMHKTDIGCVRTNLTNGELTASAYQSIMTNAKTHAPKATVRGVLIQRFLPIGHEFIIGGIRDPSFGPLVMVGLGGIYAELLRDTCFRIAPLSMEESYEMLTCLRSWKLLLGMRGSGPLAIDALASAMQGVSRLLCDAPSIREIDLNPVLVSDTTITVADAKIVVEPHENVSKSAPENEERKAKRK